MSAISKPVDSSSPRGGDVLCFVVDTTGSMGSWIAALVQILTELVDVATMTQCFDAIGVLEYGDYDKDWIRNCPPYKHCFNEAYRCCAPSEDAIPVRFSGWGLIGAEARRAANANDDLDDIRRVVVDETTRVSVDDVHTFAAAMKARGGGGHPEAFKTALNEFGLIAKHSLRDTTQVHAIHLTDAPMHAVANRDCEGKKEAEYFSQCKVDVLSSPGKFGQTNSEDSFHFAPIIRTLLNNLGGTTTQNEKNKALSPDEAKQVFPVNSRLRFTSICSDVNSAGPFGVLAALTGGSVIHPVSVSVSDLRKTLTGILNVWTGIEPCISKKEDEAGTLLSLQACDKTFVLPGTAEFVFNLEAGYETKKNQGGDAPVLPVTTQPGPAAAVKKCLRDIKKGIVNEKDQEALGSCLRRCCTRNPMALCANAILGKIWRRFTKNRDDPRRGEFLALLDKAKRALSGDDLAIFSAWNADSYDATAEIQYGLNTFIQTKGVKGVVYFEGGEAYGESPFIPQSLSNAFVTCDRDAQKEISAILSRVRIDLTFTYNPAPTTTAPSVEKKEKKTMQKKKKKNSSSSDDDDSSDEEVDETIVLPIPENALPLNLPPVTFFRLLLHIAVPGTSLTLRPSAILASLALRSGCVLRRAAASYLQSICGRWISYEDMPDESGPRIPENYSPAFMRCVLRADEAMSMLQAKTIKAFEEKKKEKTATTVVEEEGAAPQPAAEGAAVVATDNSDTATLPSAAGRSASTAGTILDFDYSTFTSASMLTWDERAAMRKLLRLSTMTRVDNWEVMAEISDVTSTDAVAADYVLECNLCKVTRPMSIVAPDGICGYCKFSQTPEGESAYGTRFKPAAEEAVSSGDKKKKSDPTADGTAAVAAADDKQQKKPNLVPINPAPAPADPSGTFQVRCTTCCGYYSRDRDVLVTVKSKCYYCLLGKACDVGGCQDDIAQKKTKESLIQMQSQHAKQKKSPPFAHLHQCRQCKNMFVGAPNRPLPNNSTCASCVAGIPPRVLTAVAKPMRVSKIFPYSLYWREYVELSGQKLRNATTVLEDENGYKATMGSLATAAKAFVIPCVGEKKKKSPSSSAVAAPLHNDDVQNDDVDAAKPVATEDADGEFFIPHEEVSKQRWGNEADIPMPPNRWTAFVAKAVAKGQKDVIDPLPAIANTEAIWRHIITSIRNHRGGGNMVMCAMCCGDFLPDQMRPVCGRKGCTERVCIACSDEWYGGNGSTTAAAAAAATKAVAVNTLGSILAPRRLYCPCCARIPAPRVLRATNPDIVFAGPQFYARLAAIDTNANSVGWCVGCTQPAIHSEKRCFAATVVNPRNNPRADTPTISNEERAAAALREITDFMCEVCVEAREAARRAEAEAHRRAQITTVTANLKRCPRCTVLTFRVSGCHHITCPCGCHWCFTCGKDFTKCVEEVYRHNCNRSHDSIYVEWTTTGDGNEELENYY